MVCIISYTMHHTQGEAKQVNAKKVESDKKMDGSMDIIDALGIG